jgi:diacylglycerol kinase (ATP)
MAATRAPGPASPPAVRRHVVVVANRNAHGAARHRRVERAAFALAALGAEVDVVRTGSPEEVAPLWAPAPGRLLVLVGGDGTLHSAANLPGPPPDVALVPAGTANNVARCLGIPPEPEDAARVALQAPVRPVDLIECRAGSRRLVAVEGLSVGFLALARSRYRGRNSADVRAAVAAGAAALAHFHPMDVRITEHGHADTVHIGQLFVANMACFGTGMRVAPHADPRDGWLDVVALDIPGRRAVPAMLLRLRRGTHLGHPGVRRWPETSLRIETRGRSPVMADTEDLGPGPVDVRVLPAALPVVAPA